MSSKRVAFQVEGTVQGKHFNTFNPPGQLYHYACSEYQNSSLTDSSLGVGFRAFAQKCARGFGLIGWTKNTIHGKVEGEVQGDAETIEKFMQQIEKGPSMAHVIKLETREMEPLEGESHFAVRKT
ncbi:acylphosphatase [Penicillium odoratum]|uniref:acylphosphatase n=1 Tax=Penicillium odoratum TaxID=1167516 RepID=UPI002547444C|nr:acylphosphatase [Penicillium odoratum]KAJ5759361.1 acylphosphatase [Penicillium odoratum]